VDELDHARRFDAAAGAYASGRPGYPPEMAAWIAQRAGLAAGSPVLDLGAGTGELTRILLGAGLDVTAAEPSPPMRAVLESRFPDLRVIDERAERLSASAGAFELVTAANALHWFDPARAFPEIGRVLKEGSCLAVIWNVPDLEDPLQAELERVRELLPPGSQKTAWGEDGLPMWDEIFETIDEMTWKHVHRLSGPGIADFVGSWSAVANLGREERKPVLARVREITGDREAELRFIVSATLVRPLID
jgi:SAM-dependent methyltransferase